MPDQAQDTTIRRALKALDEIGGTATVHEIANQIGNVNILDVSAALLAAQRLNFIEVTGQNSVRLLETGRLHIASLVLAN